MPLALILRPGRGLSPLSVLAVVLVFAGLFSMMKDRIPLGGQSGVPCDPLEDPECEESEFEGPEFPFGAPGTPRSTGPVLSADEACRGVGYLCADLAQRDRIRIERWKDFSGTIVIHVPRPDFESAGDARRLQTAAAAGLRAWNGQPFAISIDERGDRNAHFAVRWTQSLGGSQIGVARTQWHPTEGRQVLSIELTTRSPYSRGRVIDPGQIRLTAAHEMGHALGLPHSDAPRDVMYPTNTATSLSAQDHRSMEALYALEDGTEIVR